MASNAVIARYLSKGLPVRSDFLTVPDQVLLDAIAAHEAAKAQEAFNQSITPPAEVAPPASTVGAAPAPAPEPLPAPVTPPPAPAEPGVVVAVPEITPSAAPPVEPAPPPIPGAPATVAVVPGQEEILAQIPFAVLANKRASGMTDAQIAEEWRAANTQSAVLGDEPWTGPASENILTPGMLNDADLAAFVQARPDHTAFAEELRLRQLSDSRSFLENITDSQTRDWFINRTAAMAGGGLLSAVNLPANLVGLYGFGAMGAEGAAGLLGQDINLGSAQALEFAATQADAAQRVFGVGEPRNIQETIANLAPAVIPIGGGPARGLNAGVELLLPFSRGGPASMFGNASVQFIADQVVREVIDTDISASLDPNQPPTYRTAFDIAGLPEMTPEATALAMAAAVGTAVAPGVVRSLYGTQRLQTITSQIMGGNPPAPQPPRSAAITDLYPVTGEKAQDLAGVRTIERTSDLLMATVVDDKGALLRLLEYGGIPNPERIRRAVEMDTQMEAVTKATEAFRTGTLHSIYGNFQSPVPPQRLQLLYQNLPPNVQADVDQYLKAGQARDQLEYFVANNQVPANITNPQAMIQAFTDLRQTLRNRYPPGSEFVMEDYARDFYSVMDAALAFQRRGTYASLTNDEYLIASQQNSHFVPITPNYTNRNQGLGPRLFDAFTGNQQEAGAPPPITRRGLGTDIDWLNNSMPAVDAMAEFIPSVLREQLHTNTRSAIIGNMLLGGPATGNFLRQTIKSVDQAAAARNPQHAVEVVRRGVREYYLTSRLMKQLLDFDPYIINEGLAGVMGASRRIFEQATTGAATVSFAPYVALRDTMAGWANATAGMLGPTPISTAGAMVGATAAQFAHAAGQSLLTNPMWRNLPWSDATREAVAMRLGAMYERSIYHAASDAGVTGTNYMTSRHRMLPGATAEVQRALDDVGQGVAQFVNNLPGGEIVTAGGRITAQGLTNFFNGLKAVYINSMDAPRVGAFQRNMHALQREIDAAAAAGRPMRQEIIDARIDAIAAESRAIAGDTGRSGRAGLQANVVNKTAGAVVGAIQTPLGWAQAGIPYLNPATQGLRRMVEAAVADPGRFALRQWMSVGLPALGLWAWNDMVGKMSADGTDYNQWVAENRSARDNTITAHLAIPGLGPERMANLPLAHEQSLFYAPYVALLNELKRAHPDLGQAIQNAGRNMMEYVVAPATPTLVQSLGALSGVNMPDSIGEFVGGGSYEVRDDLTGPLPGNIEAMLREQFGFLGGAALEATYSALQADDFTGAVAAAGSELYDTIIRRQPVVSGPLGLRPGTADFTNLSADRQEKLNSFYQFSDLWANTIGRNSAAHRETPFPGVNQGMPSATSQFPTGGIPTERIMPDPRPRPENPIYELYGEQIYRALDSNDRGAANLQARYNQLRTHVQLLRGWQSGRRADYEEFQRQLDAPGATQDQIDAKYFLDTLGLDLNNRQDVRDLINILEQERNRTAQLQVNMIENLEQEIQADLVNRGLWPANVPFRFEHHLGPNIPDPMKAYQAQQQWGAMAAQNLARGLGTPP